MHKTTTRRQALVLPPPDVRHRSNEKRSGCSMILIPAAVLAAALAATRLHRSAS